MKLPTGHKNCPKCGGKLKYRGQGSTMVGYFSPPGHDHDDNCKTDMWECKNGHAVHEKKQNTCPACDWKGKTECFCGKYGVFVQRADN